MVQKSCAAGDVDQQFYVVQTGTASYGNCIIEPVSFSKAGAGLGAGNACLTSSVGGGDTRAPVQHGRADGWGLVDSVEV